MASQVPLPMTDCSKGEEVGVGQVGECFPHMLSLTSLPTPGCPSVPELWIYLPP